MKTQKRHHSLVSYFFLGLALLVSVLESNAQDFTQTIKGRIIDQDSNSPLIGATVVVVDSRPTARKHHGYQWRFQNSGCTHRTCEFEDFICWIRGEVYSESADHFFERDHSKYNNERIFRESGRSSGNGQKGQI